MWSLLIELFFVPIDWIVRFVLTASFEGVTLGGLFIAMLVLSILMKQLVRSASGNISNNKSILNNEKRQNQKQTKQNNSDWENRDKW